MITFYDFDQDHADGPKGYIRETMYVTNFTTMFLSSGTSLEKNFSIDIENGLDTTFATDPRLPIFKNGLRGSSQWRGGFIPVTTFDNWDWSEDRRLAIHRPRGWGSNWPPTNPASSSDYDAGFITAMQAMYDYTEASGGAYNGPYTVSSATAQVQYSDGVILRSTEQGTGPPMFPKSSWLGCQDACASGMTPQAGQTCDMGSYTCHNSGGWNGVAPWGGACSASTRAAAPPTAAGRAT